jgi:DNA-directed RNA polymerase specialized sigma24 family protein
MSASSSVSEWIAGLAAQDAQAAARLWDRYSGKLVELAAKRLGKAPRHVADEEDVAACVFSSLCRGAAEGRLQNLTNRDELWWLLVRLTRQKVADYVRRETAQKRGYGQTQLAPAVGLPEAWSLDEVIGNDPTPEYLVSMQEEYRRLLGLLRDDKLRCVAARRIEGYTVDEIAVQLSLSKRSIERKLRLIRSKWSREFQV